MAELSSNVVPFSPDYYDFLALCAVYINRAIY